MNPVMVPLAALIKEEARSEKMERPLLRYGCASQSKKGEDFFLMKTDCVRVTGNPSSTFAVFAVSKQTSLLSLYSYSFFTSSFDELQNYCYDSL